MTVENEKLEKILRCIGKLENDLHKYRNDRTIQERIDLYYYVQKETELKLLAERVDEVVGLLKFVRENLGAEYEEVYRRWRSDVRWLNHYLSGRLQEEPVGKP